MQSIQFLNDGSSGYLLVSCDGDILEGYETQLFQLQELPFFLRYEIRDFNGEKNIYYPLKHQVSIKSIMEHFPFSVYQIKNMLSSIINVIQVVEEYLLHYDRIVWKSEQIFMETDSGNLHFCYNPIEKQDNGTLQKFLAEILAVTGKKNQDSFLLLLEFYNLITNPSYTLEQLWEFYNQHLVDTLYSNINSYWGESERAILEEERREIKREGRKKNSGIEKQGIEEKSLDRKSEEKKNKEKEKKVKKEKLFSKIVRCVLIAVAVLNALLIIGMLCNLLTYHYIRYLIMGMIAMIVVTIVYMNVDNEDSADEIMQEYFTREQEKEFVKKDESKRIVVTENSFEQDLKTTYKSADQLIEYKETTVLSAEKDTHIYCIMPVVKDQFSPIYIQNESTVIGCWDKGCDYVIAKKGVSRMHCKFIRNKTELYIMDLNSTNGTYVNGERIESGKEYKVEEGDIIAFARLEFFVLIE